MLEDEAGRPLNLAWFRNDKLYDQFECKQVEKLEETADSPNERSGAHLTSVDPADSKSGAGRKGKSKKGGDKKGIISNFRHLIHIRSWIKIKRLLSRSF